MNNKRGRKKGITFALPDRLLVLMLEMKATEKNHKDKFVPANKKEKVRAPIELTSFGLSGILGVDKKEIKERIQYLKDREGVDCIETSDQLYGLIPGEEHDKNLSRSRARIHYLTEHGERIAREKIEELKKAIIHVKDEEEIIEYKVDDLLVRIKNDLDGQNRYFFFSLIGEYVQESPFEIEELYRCFPFKIDVQYKILKDSKNDLLFRDYIRSYIPKLNQLYDKVRKMKRTDNVSPILAKQDYILKSYDNSIKGLNAISQIKENDVKVGDDDDQIDSKMEVDKKRLDELLDHIIKKRYNFVIGDSGSGKTTLLSQISNEIISNSKYPKYPINLDFSAYRGESIFDWMKSELKSEVDRIEIDYGLEKAIEEDMIVIIVDSLDENPTLISTFFSNVDIYSRSNPGIHYIFASRLKQIPVESCNVISISSLSIESRDSFVRESLKDEEQSEKIIIELNKNQMIGNLSKNPMFLNILCVLITNDYTLPRGKNQLLKDVVTAFIEWGRSRINSSKSDENELMEIYSYIAYKTMILKKSSFSIEDLGNDEELMEVNIIEYMDRSVSSDSIFLKKGEVYQFFHKSFQEFLASNWIGIYDLIDDIIDSAIEDLSWWFPVLEFFSSGTNPTKAIRKMNVTWNEDIFYSKLKVMSIMAIEGRMCESNLLKKLYENLITYSISSNSFEEERYYHGGVRWGISGVTFSSLIDRIALKIDDLEYLISKYESLIPEDNANKIDKQALYSFPRLFQYFELLSFNEPAMDTILLSLDNIIKYISEFKQKEWWSLFSDFVVKLFDKLLSETVKSKPLYYSRCLEIIKDQQNVLTEIQCNLIQGLLHIDKDKISIQPKKILVIIRFILQIDKILQGDEENLNQNLNPKLLDWMKTIIYMDDLDDELRRTLFNLLMDDPKIIEDFSPDGFPSPKSKVSRGTYFLTRMIWELENESDPQSKWERIIRIGSPFFFPYQRDTKLEFISSISDSIQRLMDKEKDTVIRNGLIVLINKFGVYESFSRLMEIQEKYRDDPIWSNNIDTDISKEEAGNHFGPITRYIPVHSPSNTFLTSILLRSKRDKDFVKQTEIALDLLENGTRDQAQNAFDFIMDFCDMDVKMEALYWLFRSDYPFQIYILDHSGTPQIDPRIFRNVFTIVLDMEDFADLCTRLMPFYGEDDEVKNGVNRVLIMYPGLADERVLFDSMEFDKEGHLANVILNYIVTIISRDLIRFHKETIDKIKEYSLIVFEKFIMKQQGTTIRRNEVVTNLLFVLSYFNIKLPFRDIINVICEINIPNENNLHFFLRLYDIDDWNTLKEMINETLRSPEQDIGLYNRYFELLNIYRNIEGNDYHNWKSEFHKNIIELCISAEEVPFLIWNLRDFFCEEDLPFLVEVFRKYKDHSIGPYLRTLIFELSSMDFLNNYILINVTDYIPIVYDYFMGYLEIGSISDNEKYNLLYNTIWDLYPEERSKLIKHKFSSEHFIRLIDKDPDEPIMLDGLRSLSKACSNCVIDNIDVKIHQSEHVEKIIDQIEEIFLVSEDPSILADCLVIIKALNPTSFTHYFKHYNDMILNLFKENKIDLKNDQFINPEKMTTISYPFFIMDQIADGNLEFVDYIMRFIEEEIFTKSKEYISHNDDQYHRIGTSICRGARTTDEIMSIISRYPILFDSIKSEITYLFRGSGYFSREGMGLPEILYDLS